MSSRLKGTNQITRQLADGTSKTYHYAWKGGPPLPGEPDSPEYEAAYHEAHKIKEDTPSSDQLWYVLREFKKSPEFGDLVPKSQYEYGRAMDDIDTRFGNWPSSTLSDKRTRGIFKKWRQEISNTRGRRTADYWWSVLSRILSWGIENGPIDVNPCVRGGRLHCSGSRIVIIWSAEQEATFLAEAKERFRLALLLGIWTGQREGDLVRLTWSAYDGRCIRLEQRKSKLHSRRRGKPGKRVVIPVVGPLKATLDAAKREAALTASEEELANKRILLNSEGQPWASAGAFAYAFGRERVKAKVFGLTFHDLRGTAVVRMAIAGCTVPEIASVTGHNLGEVRTILEIHYLYLDQALSENAMCKLENWISRPTDGQPSFEVRT
jgi:integrase